MNASASADGEHEKIADALRKRNAVALTRRSDDARNKNVEGERKSDGERGNAPRLIASRKRATRSSESVKRARRQSATEQRRASEPGE